MTWLAGTAVALDGHGVLLTGDSGSGKSDLALRLIDRGARLVADDQVAARQESGQVWLHPSERLPGIIEVRGVGLCRVAVSPAVRLRLVVRLAAHYPRLPESDSTDMLGVMIPCCALQAFELTAALKVELWLRSIMTEASA